MYKYKIHDKMYDLTDFVKIHPGGVDMFNNLKPNTNITPMIYSYHKNPKAILEILPKYEIPLTDNIKYDMNYTYESYCELKRLVYDEIYEKKIPLYWSNKEIVYNFFMLSLYFGTCAYSFWVVNVSYAWMTLLVFMNTGICNLIFHEVAHYTGFKNQTINRYLTIFSYPLMEESNWKFIHNYAHHCFTNTQYDYDFLIKNEILRHSSIQNYNWYNKYQIFYTLLLFPLSLIYKIFYISLKKGNSKNWICGPILVFSFGIYKTVFWYSSISLIFAFIAQFSHIHHECIEINKEKKNDFLYNQVSSSMNYKTGVFTRLLCFSLDIQIEHHLFPNIPHSSLRQIQHIVRNYCNKNDIPYIEKESIFSACYSYFSHLYKMSYKKLL